MGGHNVNESFSYHLSEMETINKAKMIATRNRQSFSKLVLEAIKSYIREQDEQKNLDAQVSCLGHPIRHEQDYIINGQYNILSFCEKKSSERYCILESLDNDRLTKVAIFNRETREQIDHIRKNKK